LFLSKLILIPRKSEWLELDGMWFCFGMWQMKEINRNPRNPVGWGVILFKITKSWVILHSEFLLTFTFAFIFPLTFLQTGLSGLRTYRPVERLCCFHEFMSRLKFHFVMRRCASRSFILSVRNWGDGQLKKEASVPRELTECVCVAVERRTEKDDSKVESSRVGSRNRRAIREKTMIVSVMWP
jgi:hypothetical protein